MDKGRKYRSWSAHFLTYNFLSVFILNNVTAAYFLLCITDIFDNLFQMVACVCRTNPSNE